MTKVKTNGCIGSPVFNRYMFIFVLCQGQGHDQNRQKSNQVIYSSGPSILPKTNEIPKIDRKLSREQKSVAVGGVQTVYVIKPLSHTDIEGNQYR